jgi:endogenous inhibitor of DNA gyrase (YacG/DUF329 family)
MAKESIKTKCAVCGASVRSNEVTRMNAAGNSNSIVCPKCVNMTNRINSIRKRQGLKV